MEFANTQILIIGGKDFVMESLVETGIAFTLLQQPGKTTTWQQQHAEQVIEVDIEDELQCVKIAQNLAKTISFRGVFSFTEYGLSSAALISEQLQLPGNCIVETVRLTKDKSALRDRLQQHEQFRVPFLSTACLEAAKQFLSRFEQGIIVKPVEGAGSVGVHHVTDSNSLKTAFAYSAMHRCDMLLEPYIGGEEFSIESLSKSGEHEILAITKKWTSGAPHFVETGHEQPACLDSRLNAKIKHFVLALLDIIGHQNGPCHTEVKLHNDTLHLIETQTRNGGDNIWDMTRVTTGADLFKETYCHMLNIPYQRQSAIARHSLVKYFNRPLSSKDLSKLNQSGALRRSEFQTGIAHDMPLTSSFDRAGYIMLHSDNQLHTHQLLQDIQS